MPGWRSLRARDPWPRAIPTSRSLSTGSPQVDPECPLVMGPPDARLVDQVGPAGVVAEMPSADVMGGDHRPSLLAPCPIGPKHSSQTLVDLASANRRPLSSAHPPMSDVWVARNATAPYREPGAVLRRSRERVVIVDALDAATRCAQELGLGVERPVVLRATNNTVVWLAPLPVVAKVGTGHHHSLGLEIEVARLLAAADAPIVPRQTASPARVYEIGEFGMNFWRYQPQDAVPDPTATLVATVLAELHRALRHLPPPAGDWPRFDKELHELQRRLDDEPFAPELSNEDRRLLRRTIADGLDELHARALAQQPLHGSPQRLNILIVEGSPCFIDFETVCEGPLEWDLAHLEPEVAHSYPPSVDDQALTRLPARRQCQDRSMVLELDRQRSRHALPRGSSPAGP